MSALHKPKSKNILLTRQLAQEYDGPIAINIIDKEKVQEGWKHLTVYDG